MTYDDGYYAKKAIEKARDQIEDAVKFNEKESYFGGTLYTDRAKQRLTQALVDIERYNRYLLKSMKAEEKYRMKIAKHATPKKPKGEMNGTI